MVTAFGLNNFASMRILVDLDGTCAALGNRTPDNLPINTLGIQNCNNLTQAFAVVSHQSGEFLLKFYFFLQAGIFF